MGCCTCRSSFGGTWSGSAQVCGPVRAGEWGGERTAAIGCLVLFFRAVPHLTFLLTVSRGFSVKAASFSPSRSGVCHGDNSNRISDQNKGSSGNLLYIFWDLLSLHHLPLHMWDIYSLVRSVLIEGGGGLLYKGKKAAGGIEEQDRLKSKLRIAELRTIREEDILVANLQKNCV